MPKETFTLRLTSSVIF